jgi:hypothetical protein
MGVITMEIPPVNRYSLVRFFMRFVEGPQCEIGLLKRGVEIDGALELGRGLIWSPGL